MSRDVEVREQIDFTPDNESGLEFFVDRFHVKVRSMGDIR